MFDSQTSKNEQTNAILKRNVHVWGKNAVRKIPAAFAIICQVLNKTNKWLSHNWLVLKKNKLGFGKIRNVSSWVLEKHAMLWNKMSDFETRWRLSENISCMLGSNKGARLQTTNFVSGNGHFMNQHVVWTNKRLVRYWEADVGKHIEFIQHVHLQKQHSKLVAVQNHVNTTSFI